MKLSIIVPFYNMAAGRKLKYCMDSLVNQTVEDYEIVAVDDCSPDETYELLLEYGRRYPEKVRALRTPENRKQGGARNLGLAHAKGEWVGFMDGDDWAAPDMYEKLLAKAGETGADVVGCDLHETHEHSMKIGRIVNANTIDQTGPLDEEKYKKLMRNPCSMVIKIYRKEVIDKYHLRFPEGIFYEDNCAGRYGCCISGILRRWRSRFIIIIRTQCLRRTPSARRSAVTGCARASCLWNSAGHMAFMSDTGRNWNLPTQNSIM